MKTFPHDRQPHETGTRRIDPEQSIVRENSLNGADPVALVALVDLTVPQLAEAFRGLDQVQQHHERLSGICAIMKGLVLCEAKAKIEHGGFMAWVQENFPRSHKTANQYKRLAEEFGRLHPKVQFENLRSDLLATLERLEGFQLDLQHPLVREIADWVKGRSAYQLLLELEPGKIGGDTSKFPRKTKPTLDELHAETLEAWSLLVNELTDRAFGSAIFKVEWDRLTTHELAELTAQLFQVCEHFRDTIKERKAGKTLATD
jgi:hypothetical protein